MPLKGLHKLNDMQLSVLTEIGNIGSGNAATALASLLNTVVDIEIPNIQLIDYNKVSDFLGGSEHTALGMTVMLEGDIQGMMLQVVNTDFANHIINTFYEQNLHSLKELTEMDHSVLREMSNITTATYINSIARMTNTYINISPPNDYIDTIGNIVNIPAITFSALGQQVLFIDERLRIAGAELTSNMILILELNSMRVLFEKLGIPC